MSVANWISDPVVESVAVNPPVAVLLSMHRNGNANVSVDFPNEPDGSVANATTTCMAGQVLCGARVHVGAERSGQLRQLRERLRDGAE